MMKFWVTQGQRSKLETRLTCDGNYGCQSHANSPGFLAYLGLSSSDKRPNSLEGSDVALTC